MQKYRLIFVFLLGFFIFLPAVSHSAVTCVNGQVDSVFVIDKSGSMVRDCGAVGGPSKMDCVKDGIKTIIDSQKMVNASMGIYVADADFERIVNLTKVAGNQTFLKSRVDSITMGSGTTVGDALKDALIYLNKTKAPEKEGFILLITDGRIDDGILNTPQKIIDYISANWKDGPIEIYTMGVGAEGDFERDLLERIANDTNGKFYHADVGCYGACMANNFLNALDLACEITTPPKVSVIGAPINWQNTNAIATVGCVPSNISSGNVCDNSSYRYRIYASNPGTCSSIKASYTLGASATVSNYAWICAYAENKAGDFNVSRPTEFKIDKVLPKITVSHTPINPLTTDTVTITASATDDRGLKNISIYVDGSLKNTCIVSGLSASCTYASAYAAGVHNYYAVVYDVAKNRNNSVTNSFSVNVPCTLNSVRITPNCAGGINSDCEPGEKITVNATYVGACPATVYIQVDTKNTTGTVCNTTYSGGTIQGINITTTASGLLRNWTIPVAMPSVCLGKLMTSTNSALYMGGWPGTGTLANAVVPSGSFRFYTPDTAPPRITINKACANPGKNNWCKGNVGITLACTDNNPPCGAIRYEYYNSTYNSGWGTYSTPFSILFEGRYTLNVTANDSSGNRGYNSTDVWIDKTPPRVTSVTDSPDPVTSSAEITFSEIMCDDYGMSGCANATISANFLTMPNSCGINPISGFCTLITPACGYGNYNYAVAGGDNAGWTGTLTNIGNFLVTNAEGCGCTSNDECSSGFCFGGVCGAIIEPEVSFYESRVLEILLGTTGQAVINVKNTLNESDTIELSIYGISSKINNWIWFDGHRHDSQRTKVVFDLKPHETKSFAANIFGGELTSSAGIRAVVKSGLTGFDGEAVRDISIVYSENGIDVQTPEPGWFGVTVIALISAILIIL